MYVLYCLLVRIFFCCLPAAARDIMLLSDDYLTRICIFFCLQPTNHLNSETMQALCNALESYQGAVIVVSHDEAFVSKVIEGAIVGDKDSGIHGELWVMSKGKLARFDGSFKAYKSKVLKKVMASL